MDHKTHTQLLGEIRNLENTISQLRFELEMQKLKTQTHSNLKDQYISLVDDWKEFYINLTKNKPNR